MQKLIIILAAIMLFVCPAAKAEEEQSQAVWARLDVCIFWDQAVTADIHRSETLPVYAAPSEDAWRGANGKAAVSLREPFTVIAAVQDTDWLLIEYDISVTERRVGYVQKTSGMAWPEALLPDVAVETTLTEDVSLTDDPRASQRVIAALSEGASVLVLGYTSDAWAYIETDVEGRKARGFAPLTAIDRPLQAMKSRLEGAWRFTGGAEVIGYGAIFSENGRVVLCDTDDFDHFPPERLIPKAEQTFDYAVYANDPTSGRFWSDMLLVLWEREGGVHVYGLSLTTGEDGAPDSIHLEEGEGGGFYERYDMNL